MAALDTSWDIVLLVPCRPSFASVVRTAAAVGANLEGFSGEGRDDVRLLVDEVFVAMSEVGAEHVRLCLTPHDRLLDIEMEATAVAAPRRDPHLSSLSTVIGQIAHQATLDLAAPRPHFSATVRAS